MKKTCGYIDNIGQFHLSILECNNSNIIIKIRRLREDIEWLINNYTCNIKNRITIKNVEEEGYKLFDIQTHKVICDILDTLVRKHPQFLIDFYNKKLEIEKEIIRLNKLLKTPKFLREDWWLGKTIDVDKIFIDKTDDKLK